MNVNGHLEHWVLQKGLWVSEQMMNRLIHFHFLRKIKTKPTVTSRK